MIEAYITLAALPASPDVSLIAIVYSFLQLCFAPHKLILKNAFDSLHTVKVHSIMHEATALIVGQRVRQTASDSATTHCRMQQ